MSEDNKKWYENIQKHGVLCKTNENEIVHIAQYEADDDLLPSSASGIFGGVLDYEPKDLTPLTPVEWWQFASWQDMKDAPSNEIILLSFDDNQYRADYSDLLLDGFYANKWLPLPEESQ